MSLTCSNITVCYPGADARALHGVSLEVVPGRVIGIVGASGSGKSTLLRVLAGAHNAQAGSVEADGVALGAHPTADELRAHRKTVALVQQRPELQFFAANVFDEVAFGPRNLGLDEAEVARRVTTSLARVGLDPAVICDTSPFARSGGEQRRIAIADMLALETPYLLLDEPTAGLDPHARHLLLEHLGQLARNGRGIVIATHDSRVLDICDEVFRLRDGSLLPQGSEDAEAASSGTAAARPADAERNSAMPKAISFGIYRPGGSFAHLLHPATKLVFCLLFMIAGFIAQRPFALVAVALTALASIVASGSSLLQALRALRPFRWLMGFVLVFNALFTASGTLLLQAGPVQITLGGLLFGVLCVVRFALIMLGTSTLMATTSPTALADGAATLMRPLARLGLRTDDATVAIQLTLRFVPVLVEEFNRIKAAQEARLARFDSPSPLQRARAFIPVITPLFSSALRRSDTLALAMVNREYGTCPAAGRTCIRSYRFDRADVAVLALGFCIVVIALL